jgi:hypothetical protein
MFYTPFYHTFGNLLPAYITITIPLLLALAMYILESIALYTIAKRRGIHHYGLAWVPIADNWIVGAIADQYNELVRGKRTHLRRTLLILSILQVILQVIAIVGTVTLIIGYFGVFASAFDETAYPPLTSDYITLIFLFVLICLAILVFSIILIVYSYIALYRVYSSCDPQSATLYLVLSILFTVTLPIFLLICRNKDWGMVSPQPVYYPSPASVGPEPQPMPPTEDPQ